MRKSSKIGFGLLLAAVMLVGMVGVGWGVPNMINVQGRLADKATGQAVANQTLDVTVNYYNAETGGTLLTGSGYGYSPTTDSNGVFNIILSGVPDFTSEDYYVEFVVGARIGGTWRMETIPDPTLPSPANKRQRLVAVPFAITAKNVRGGTVVAVDATGKAAVSGTAGDYGALRVLDETLRGHGLFGESRNTGKAGVYGKGQIGVIGFDERQVRDATGTYGILGGLPLHYTAVAGETRKYGVFGQADGNNRAVLGYYNLASGATVPLTYAVYGWSINGTPVYGYIPATKADGATANDNIKPAVYGYNLSPASGAGVMGKGQPGVKGEYSGDANVLGQLGSTKSFSVYYNDDGTTVVGGTDLLRKAGTLGQMSSSTFGTLGVKLSGTGVPADEHGVYGETDSNTAAIKGFNVKSTIVGTDQNPGVEGRSRAGVGVFGKSFGVNPGVYGESTQRIGVSGKGVTAGVYGVATATGYFGGVFENTNGGGVSGTSNTTFYSGVSAVNRGTDNIGGNADDGSAIYINSIIQLVPRATPPTTRAVRGMVYYDSGSDEIKVYNGYSWRSLQYKP